ncbi:FLJ37770-like protein [Acromyrmex echinatior]|uniref:FLJ37770-like protein n=1 Tax=Acromyrmex echinatior TaxID=103372 RepID=F4WTF9_ACREC|nr:FLJ37770-like protein [Acromyrmex echinatior]
MDQRVIKFNAKLGKSASETFRSMQQVYGSQCLGRTAVFEWHKRFLEGRETLQDDKKSGRPILVRTPEIEKVHSATNMCMVRIVSLLIFKASSIIFSDALRSFATKSRTFSIISGVRTKIGRPDFLSSSLSAFQKTLMPLKNSCTT